MKSHHIRIILLFTTLFVIGFAAYQLFTDDTSYTPSLPLKTFSIDNVKVAYEILNVNESKVKHQIGDYYKTIGSMQLYRLKDSDNLEKIILLEDEHYTMLEFLELCEPGSYSFILNNIFGVTSGDGIKKIKFYADDGYSDISTYPDIAIPKVTLTDTESKNQIYSILCNIQITMQEDLEDSTVLEETPDTSDSSSKAKQARYNYVHSRKIDIIFTNGTSYTFLYNSLENYIYAYSQTMSWSKLSDSDNLWLMEKAEI